MSKRSPRSSPKPEIVEQQLSERISQLQKEAMTLEKRNLAVETEIREFKQAGLKLAEIEIAEAKKQLTPLNHELKKLTLKVTAKLAELKALKNQSEPTLREIEQTEARLYRLSEAEKDAQASIISLAEKEADAKALVTTQETKLGEIDAKITSSTEILDKTKTAVALARKDLDDLQADYLTRKSSSETELAELTAKIADASKLLKETMARGDNIMRNLAERTKTLDERETVLKRRELSISGLEEKALQFKRFMKL